MSYCSVRRVQHGMPYGVEKVLRISKEHGELGVKEKKRVRKTTHSLRSEELLQQQGCECPTP